MICPSCHVETEAPRSVTPDATPTQGDIYLCPTCAKPAVYTLLGWKPMSESELLNLSPDEKADLDFAIRNIQAYHRPETL